MNPSRNRHLPRSALLLASVVLAVAVAYVLFVRQPRAVLEEFSGETMGTTYTVKIDAPSIAGVERAALVDSIALALQTVNNLMSTYDPASEVSRFNRHESTTPFPVSPLTLQVVEVAQAVSEQTGGAFDVTVGPLVEVWGFGPTLKIPSIPSDHEIAQLRQWVGYDQIVLDGRELTLTKRHPKTSADLSAVAKGFGVDRVAEMLQRQGFERYLVEVGGEVRAGAPKRDGHPWRIAVETPDTAWKRAVFRTMELTHMAAATSGDYRNYFELDGVRYAHIIDPRTGRPTRHTGAAVTVLHPRGAVADAWATALSVLGPEDGLALAEREGVAALFVVRVGEGYEARGTSAFERLSPG